LRCWRTRRLRVAISFPVTFAFAVSITIAEAVSITFALAVSITVAEAVSITLAEAVLAGVLEEPPERVQPVLRGGRGSRSERFIHLVRRFDDGFDVQGQRCPLQASEAAALLNKVSGCTE
jgi:hypothetical protein